MRLGKLFRPSQRLLHILDRFSPVFDDSSITPMRGEPMRIYVNRDHVITWINGTQMVNFHDAKIGEAMGQIALQIHDGGGIKVKWRNIEIREY